MHYATRLLVLLSPLLTTLPCPADDLLPTADGFTGIWYHIGDKYGGGFATYPQQIRPTAIYAPKVNKTFFVYGGTNDARNTLLHMVSYYDHATGEVARPRILLDKKVTDAHDNPCLAIDDQGFLFIFSNTHGPAPRSSIHRSTKPYCIDAFEEVFAGSFSYGDAWFVPASGLFFLHNRYQDGRAIAFMTSPDGRAWSKPTLLAQMPKGHYSISGVSGSRVGVAFNYHPHGLDSRTNLYYVETPDFGKTWKTATGENVTLPLKDVHGPELVVEAESKGLLVYLKDIEFDPQGRPILFYLTSHDFNPGPKGDPRILVVSHWLGDHWDAHDVTTVDHNYDFGQLYLEPDGTWKIIAPTDPGPQPGATGATGGDVVMWLSHDQGATWTRGKTVTHDSKLNATYVREPINARDDFYAFWADGDPLKPSPSSLYFTSKAGEHVWQLPPKMTGDTAKPKLVH